MLSIISNVNALVAEQNLNGSGNALSAAISRLSSGKRINSATDDAAGLAISVALQTGIDGLNQGVANANDAVSMVQTATGGLAQITQSLQTIRQLAEQSADGALSASNQAALQQAIAQQIAEVNRIASQTAYNGINLLNGSAGLVNVQIGASVGQTVSLDLNQDVSAGSLGVFTGGDLYVPKGTSLGTITNLDLTASGAGNSSGGTGAITQINVLADGHGGYQFTDQNDQALPSSITSHLFATTPSHSTLSLSLSGSAGNGLSVANQESALLAAINTGSLGTLGGIAGISLDPVTGLPVPAGTPNAITSVTVTRTAGGLNFFDQNGNSLTGLTNIVQPVTQGTVGWPSAIGSVGTGVQTAGTVLAGINAGNVAVPLNHGSASGGATLVASIDVTTPTGADSALRTVDVALATIDNLQATLGAAQNRLTAVAASQQDESTDLAAAQAQIVDADFAQESANLSKAEVLRQAGISVLAQANSQPQQVLKLLQ